MTRIIVEVRGGCVTSIFSDDSEIKVEVLDYDNLKESDDVAVHEQAEELESEIEAMTEVW